MKYVSYVLTALGAVGLLYLQFETTDGVGRIGETGTWSMLFAGASLTMGLLLLVISDDRFDD